MTAQHELTALHGDSPLGFLAALGALLVLSQDQQGEPPRLAWDPSPPHPARLTTTALTPDALAETLFSALTKPDACLPRKAVGPGKLKELTLAAYRDRMAHLDPFAAALLAGMCSDVTAKENPERGPLVMTSGPQDFPKIVADAAATLKKGALRSVSSALFGPWEYEEGHPLGFDPAMERRHAYMASKPKSDAEHVPAVLLLAVSALALLPLYPCDTRKRFGNGLFKDPRWEELSWTLWAHPLSLAAAGSLVNTFDGQHAPGKEGAGLVAAYVSERSGIETAAGIYYVLRAGRRLW